MSGTFTPVFNAFRFYNDDGDEANSTPYDSVAQDTNITVDDEADEQFHLRVRIDETGGKGGSNGDDWRLEISVNGGTYTDVTSTSSVVDGQDSTHLTDGGATTNRGTNGISDPGSGSFDVGEQSDLNGEVFNHVLGSDDFAEHVYGLRVTDADVSDGDTIDFRITLNGGSPGMTNNVTPRITISKGAAALAGHGPLISGKRNMLAQVAA